jgi:hypothetical protein
MTVLVVGGGVEFTECIKVCCLLVLFPCRLLSKVVCIYFQILLCAIVMLTHLDCRIKSTPTRSMTLRNSGTQ